MKVWVFTNEKGIMFVSASEPNGKAKLEQIYGHVVPVVMKETETAYEVWNGKKTRATTVQMIEALCLEVDGKDVKNVSEKNPPKNTATESEGNGKS